MKYYQDLVRIPVITFKTASEIIGNYNAAAKTINRMISEGSMHRIKQGLFTCVDFSTGNDYANRFQIGSSINENSFISFHSAFEFYGLYNQSYFNVQVSSTKRFKEFSYDDYNYKSYLTSSLDQINTIQGVKVSSIERTIIDSIYMIGKVMDAEELTKCLSLVHIVDENKLLEMLSLYNKEILYRKTGYVLSYFKNELSISDKFFNVCKNKGNVKNKGFLIGNDKEDLTFNSEWGLYAYKSLKKLIEKGEK